MRKRNKGGREIGEYTEGETASRLSDFSANKLQISRLRLQDDVN